MSELKDRQKPQPKIVVGVSGGRFSAMAFAVWESRGFDVIPVHIRTDIGKIGERFAGSFAKHYKRDLVVLDLSRFFGSKVPENLIQIVLQTLAGFCDVHGHDRFALGLDPDLKPDGFLSDLNDWLDVCFENEITLELIDRGALMERAVIVKTPFNLTNDCDTFPICETCPKCLDRFEVLTAHKIPNTILKKSDSLIQQRKEKNETRPEK